MKRILVSAVLLSVLALAACSGTQSDAAPQTTSPSPSPTASPTPKPTPTPKQSKTPIPPRTVGWQCSIKEAAKNNIGLPKYTTVVYRTLPERWAAQNVSSCEIIVLAGGPYSTAEREAVAAAKYSDLSKVKYLWQICGETDKHYQTTGPINDEQRAESNAALLLCPDHPSAATMASGSPEQKEREAGLRFGAGVKEVGTQIQSGTYRATGDIKDCYWERLDAAGGTIDNDFVLAATQVEVTVLASDFALSTRGCGEFVKVG